MNGPSVRAAAAPPMVAKLTMPISSPAFCRSLSSLAMAQLALSSIPTAAPMTLAVSTTASAPLAASSAAVARAAPTAPARATGLRPRRSNTRPESQAASTSAPPIARIIQATTCAGCSTSTTSITKYSP